MNRIRTAFGFDHDDTEAGLTLIEIMVSMMIFSILAIGVAFGITNSLVLTAGSQAREVAANLASQTIDLDRSLKDVFSIPLGTVTTPVSGKNYYVTTTGEWISSNASSSTDTSVTGTNASSASTVCSTGGGTLQFYRVTVDVSWDGQSAAAPDVFSDTEIAPNSRINDPQLGTIIVTATNAAGSGTQGATVTVTPTGTGLPTPTPVTTDANGCGFVLKVTPGAYRVTLTQANGIDYKQNAAPTAAVTVVAGASAPATFNYDQNASYPLALAGNVTTVTPTLPTNLNTSFVSNVGGVYIPTALTNPATLFPYTDGYAILAGSYVPVAGTSPSCIDVNPATWTTPNAAGAVGASVAKIAVAAGQVLSPAYPVKMGAVTISGMTAGNYITAVSATPPAGSGDPGCGISTTYTFPVLTSTSMTIALPYGSWSLATGKTKGSLTTSAVALGNTNTQFVTPGQGTGITNVITLDPRGTP